MDAAQPQMPAVAMQRAQRMTIVRGSKMGATPRLTLAQTAQTSAAALRLSRAAGQGLSGGGGGGGTTTPRGRHSSLPDLMSFNVGAEGVGPGASPAIAPAASRSPALPAPLMGVQEVDSASDSDGDGDVGGAAAGAASAGAKSDEMRDPSGATQREETGQPKATPTAAEGHDEGGQAEWAPDGDVASFLRAGGITREETLALLRDDLGVDRITDLGLIEESDVVDMGIEGAERDAVMAMVAKVQARIK